MRRENVFGESFCDFGHWIWPNGFQGNDLFLSNKIQNRWSPSTDISNKTNNDAPVFSCYTRVLINVLHCISCLCVSDFCDAGYKCCPLLNPWTLGTKMHLISGVCGIMKRYLQNKGVRNLGLIRPRAFWLLIDAWVNFLAQFLLLWVNFCFRGSTNSQITRKDLAVHIWPADRRLDTLLVHRFSRTMILFLYAFTKVNMKPMCDLPSTLYWPNSEQIFHEMFITPKQLEQTRW